jgi:hypothetical protein
MYSFKLTEEISRWAFEVLCMQSHDWYISFTNPTAGPWKTIKGFNNEGIEGEVLRFELEDTRPDILLVNDKLRLILIIEAKDSIQKLKSSAQIVKSVDVFKNLSSILKSKKDNPFWGERANYIMITGLLWGSEHICSYEERNELFDYYYSEISRHADLNNHFILGIEVCRINNNLNSYIFGKSYKTNNDKSFIDLVVTSFHPSILD